MAARTVGRFTIDLDEGTVEGPALYIEERGQQVLNEILGGRDIVFNLTVGQWPDLDTAVAARLQTDYAGWLGTSGLADYAIGQC